MGEMSSQEKIVLHATELSVATAVMQLQKKRKF